MDPSLYKDVITSRGLRYHYLFSPGLGSKLALVFLHGFPSSSYDWRCQVPFFQNEGYTLIVPDMLGYGGTDKPKDPASYKASAIAADIIDIMDAEKVDKAIAIGHDWGCLTASRLASYNPGRFLGFSFLAGPYLPPKPTFNLAESLMSMKQAVGYDILGYWLFFSEDGADKVIDEHLDSFFSVLYPHDPKMWITDMAPRDTLKAYILSDKRGPLPTYLTEPEKQTAMRALQLGGLAGPLNYYKVEVLGINAEDDMNVPKENYILHHPVFYGGATQDYISLTAWGKATVGEFCKNATIKDFDTDHWLPLAAPNELNNDLLAWIKEIKASLDGF